MHLRLTLLLLLTCACASCVIALPIAPLAPQAAAAPSLEDARQAFQQASTDIADVLWPNVDTSYHVGKWQDAVAICYLAIDLDPAFIEAYRSGAWLLWSLKTPQAYKQAVALYDRGIKANPDNWEIPYDCGAWFYMNHMSLAKKMSVPQAAKAAIPYLRIATRAADKTAPAGARVQVWRAFGHALRRAGDTGAAIRVFEHVLEFNPTDAVAARELAALRRAR